MSSMSSCTACPVWAAVYPASHTSPLASASAITAEEDEVIKSYVFTRAAIRRLFKSGRIVDAKTIAAFAMCGWL